MQDIEALRDYLIADEINRIQSLTHNEAIKELIDVKTRTIEQMTTIELLNLKQQL